MIFACYRKDLVPDPENYIAAVAAVLSGYPENIVNYACDPRTGITGKSKWPPSVAEINEFCESQVRRIGEDEERQRRIQRQFAEADEWMKERSEADTARMAELAKDWLDRKDLRAQIISGQKPRIQLSEGEKVAAIENATKAGKEVVGMKLSAEALEIVRENSSKVEQRPVMAPSKDADVPF